MHSFICSTSPAGNFVADFFSAVLVLNLSCSSFYRVPRWLTDRISNIRSESFFVSIFFMFTAL